MSKSTWTKIKEFPGYLINRDGLIKYEQTGRFLQPDEEHPESVMMHSPTRLRPILVPIADILTMAFTPFQRDRPAKMHYRLSASRTSSGMNGDYETFEGAVDRLKAYHESFPGEIIEATITKIR